MDMYVGARWSPVSSAGEVRDLYSGAVVETAPIAGEADIALALRTAELGAADMAALPAFRSSSLEGAADGVDGHCAELVDVIRSEQGQPRKGAEPRTSIAGEVRPGDQERNGSHQLRSAVSSGLDALRDARESGSGREGIRYAIDEMTKHKLAVVHPGQNA